MTARYVGESNRSTDKYDRRMSADNCFPGMLGREVKLWEEEIEMLNEESGMPHLPKVD